VSVAVRLRSRSSRRPHHSESRRSRFARALVMELPSESGGDSWKRAAIASSDISVVDLRAKLRLRPDPFIARNQETRRACLARSTSTRARERTNHEDFESSNGASVQCRRVHHAVIVTVPRRGYGRYGPAGTLDAGRAGRSPERATVGRPAASAVELWLRVPHRWPHRAVLQLLQDVLPGWGS
jgi:hypothetical protein